MEREEEPVLYLPPPGAENEKSTASKIESCRPTGLTGTVETQGNDDSAPYPRGLRLYGLTAALMLSELMVALDTNMIGKRCISYQSSYLLPKLSI